MPKLQLLIVADDPLARAGLAALLAGWPGVELAGQTTSTDVAAAQAAFAPDVLVWDLGWEPGARIETLSHAVDEGAPPVLALLPVPSLAAEVRAAGARALLSRNTGGPQLAAAVTALSQGLLVFDPGMAPTSAQPSNSETIIESLSARELDVLRGMAEGLSNKQIARSLEISEHTIKFHVNAILGKLGAQSRTEAVVRATRAGLILL
jgi:two-component system, NarL family, nitrate/nitrite response regulator NarL